ncbi:MAG: thioredoxin family protein [Flavobacteriaceae bacterium]|jgi:thioredoxin-related protein|nr:thioredoxin family protein [Flavobacteriaceae bacterium]
MKNCITLLVFIFSTLVFSQDRKLYNPEDNAQQKIDSSLVVAKQEHKFVLLQIGGNWCIWCLRFNKLTEETPELKKSLDDNFIVYHLNYSKENKNEPVLAQLGFPQRFGFPVFVILNENGERVHTQQTDFLEDGKTGYDIKRVQNFLEQWSPTALAPETYEIK